jgi:peptidoglycan/xylan/chitin deacetylase (PgdA/CDA1 family)
MTTSNAFLNEIGTACADSMSIEASSIALSAARVRVLAYHAIINWIDTKRLEPYRLPERVFLRQLTILQLLGWKFIGPDAFVEFLYGRSVLPREAVLLTFDDCYCDLLRLAPVLHAKGIPAIAFAVSGQLGGTNKWDERPGVPSLRLLDARELRTLRSNGIEIGAHSRTHRSLVGLSANELASEIDGSISDLKAAGLPRPRFFSYPYGQYDADCISAVRGSGVVAAFTIEPGLVSPKRDTARIPRIEILRSDLLPRFLFKVATGRGALWEKSVAGPP